MRGSKSLCIWFLQVTTLFSLLVFFLWLALRPSEPRYTLTDLSVSTTNAPTSPCNISLTFEISNANVEVGVHHGEANVTLRSSGVLLGGVTVPSFYQGRDRSMWWEGSVRVEKDTWRKAVTGGGGGGERELRVGLVARVRYRILAWETRSCTLDLEGTVPIGARGGVSLDGKRITLQRVRDS